MLTLTAFFIEQFGDLLVSVGINEPEGQIFQFPFQFPYPEAIGQGRIQFQRFAGNMYAQVVRMRGVVAQGLRPAGQAQNNNPNILDHCQQHFAQHFNLRLHFRRIDLAGINVCCDKALGNRAQLIESGNAADQMGNRFAKTLFDLRQAVFQTGRYGKKDRRHARMHIQAQTGNNHRHTQGMRPDALATAEQGIAVDFPGKFNRGACLNHILFGQTIRQGIQERIKITLCGNRKKD